MKAARDEVRIDRGRSGIEIDRLFSFFKEILFKLGYFVSKKRKEKKREEKRRKEKKRKEKKIYIYISFSFLFFDTKYTSLNRIYIFL